MNVIDAVLIIILLAGAINGFIKGFFVELASVVSLVLGIWAAVQFSGFIQLWLSRYLDWSPEMIRVVAFILIFIFVVLVIHLVATLTEKFVRAIALSFFSRLAGAVFGIIKTAFILSVLMLVIVKIEGFTGTIIPCKIKAASKLYSPIENMAPGVFPFLKAEKVKILETKPKNATT